MSLLLALTCVISSGAFIVPSRSRINSSKSLAMIVDQVPQASQAQQVLSTIVSSDQTTDRLQQNSPSYLNKGVSNFLDSPSTSVSVQEYKKPTAEEIAKKKFNFNLWFWGGGFVAPFLATFYYFGLRFWERQSSQRV